VLYSIEPVLASGPRSWFPFAFELQGVVGHAADVGFVLLMELVEGGEGGVGDVFGGFREKESFCQSDVL
jgi:hypothetical protein